MSEGVIMETRAKVKRQTDNVLNSDNMTWQEVWYYRIGLLTGLWSGVAIGLLMAVAWYIFKDACGG